jgi:hypothetical protein
MVFISYHAGLQIRDIPAIPDFKFRYWKSQAQYPERYWKKFCPRLIFLDKILLKIIQEDKQSESDRIWLSKKDMLKKVPKPSKVWRNEAFVKNFKWLEKIVSMGYARERKDVLQMWDTRFSEWIPDFKLLVSCWMLLKNSNLKLCHGQFGHPVFRSWLKPCRPLEIAPLFSQPVS